MRSQEKLVAGLLVVFLAVAIQETKGNDEKGKSHDNESSLSSSSGSSNLRRSNLEIMLQRNTLTDPRRHIRSVDSGLQQSNEQLVEEEDGIQSNSGSPSSDDVSAPAADVTHKTQRSLASSDMLRYTPTILMARESKYPLSRWYLPGLSSHFSRGGRADRNGFIRFGRSGNFDDGNFMNSHNGKKKSNFIRLGRENPRQNNFIRLGRSGLWGNGERYGSKIGFFPDYYTNMYGSTPFDDFSQPPLPFDPAEVGH